MKNTLIAALGALFLATAIAAVPTVAHADQAGHKAPKYTPKITLAQARKAALKRIPGKVLDEELEKEDGQWIYSFDIRPQGVTAKIIKEVHVDPDTGKVLAVETEHGH